MEIKVVIWDIGGVLMCPIGGSPNPGEFSKGAHEYMAKYMNLTLKKWNTCVKGPIEKSSIGKISKSRVLKELSKILDCSSKTIERVFKKAYVMSYPQNKELYKFVLGLKKKGYKIAILSDQWHISKEAIIKPSFSRNFDPIVVSCDVGMKKPQPEIYKLILKKLKIPARNCVFIDNHSMNLDPAKKLGIRTILYKNNKQLFKQLKELGVK